MAKGAAVANIDDWNCRMLAPTYSTHSPSIHKRYPQRIIPALEASRTLGAWVATSDYRP
jgi:hypothetical protein